MKILKFLILTASIIICSGKISADEPDEIPIHINPTPVDKPVKPKAPSFIKLTAYAVSDAVVVTSNVDIMAQVLIYDSASGQSYYSSTVALAPQCRCQIGSTDAMLTLQITVGDTTYEGSFCLH